MVDIVRKAGDHGLVSFEELQVATGLHESALGGKLGGQAHSSATILGEPFYIVVGHHLYRRNDNVFPCVNDEG